MSGGKPSGGSSQAARLLTAARSAVAFTGAGISTESGIPDYRSPQGIWATSRPVYFQEFLDDPEARFEYWRQKEIAFRDFSSCTANPGHRVLAKWESDGRLRGVITQNIDGLHQRAGSQSVLELHGTALKVGCLDCGERWDTEPFHRRFLDDARVPDCPNCGGRLKHATVSFGQQLPPDVLMMARQWSRQSDLFLAIGSSLVVEPAASLPRLAAEHGAKLVIINRDPTPLDELADVILRGSVGEVLQEIDELAGDQYST